MKIQKHYLYRLITAYDMKPTKKELYFFQNLLPQTFLQNVPIKTQQYTMTHIIIQQHGARNVVLCYSFVSVSRSNV